MSHEMQGIMWIATLAILIVLVWALWRRTARQSLTVLLLAVGAILVVGGGVPLIWWQLHLPQGTDQHLQIRDHRLVSQTQIKERDFVRLEAEIEIIIPALPQERLRAIAQEYLEKALSSYKPDVAAVKLRDLERPLLYEYAYRKSLPPERVQPWIQPLDATAKVHLEAPIIGELGDYHTIVIPVTVTTKWANLQALLGENRLPSNWAALDESLYDYIVVSESGQPQMVLVFALLDDEFFREYQASGGRPQELGLLQGEIPTPSLLVLVYTLQESLFRVSDLALVQKRGESVRRYEPEEETVHTLNGSRPMWMALVGNFPNFPNLLAQLRAGAHVVGLMRLPEWLDPAQGFQIYYRDRVATFGKKF